MIIVPVASVSALGAPGGNPFLAQIVRAKWIARTPQTNSAGAPELQIIATIREKA